MYYKIISFAIFLISDQNQFRFASTTSIPRLFSENCSVAKIGFPLWRSHVCSRIYRSKRSRLRHFDDRRRKMRRSCVDFAFAFVRRIDGKWGDLMGRFERKVYYGYVLIFVSVGHFYFWFLSLNNRILSQFFSISLKYFFIMFLKVLDVCFSINQAS